MQYKKPEYFEAIERAIDAYKEANGGCAPSTSQIAAAVGLSQPTVSRYLKDMDRQGLLQRDGYRSISTRRSRRESGAYQRVPVLGEIACGIPSLAEENIEDYVDLPVSLFGRGPFFLLRAKGLSMVEAGIEPGDLVLIRQQSTADYNQIVVALLEEEATLKRYRPYPDGTVHLHPENREMDDIVVEGGACVLQGVAVKVLKDVR